jgi:hypothetical protein
LLGGIITSPEFCLTNDRCITTWPTGGGGDVDITNLQNRVTGECSIGQSIIKINADGTVVCGDAENNLPKGQYCGYIRVAQQRWTTPAPDDGSITCDVNGVSYYPGIYECKYLDTDMTGSCTSTRKLGCPTGFSESQIGTADAISNNFRGDDMSAIKTYSCIKT